MAEIKPVDPSKIPSPLALDQAVNAPSIAVGQAGERVVKVPLPGGTIVEMAAPRQATQLAVGAIMGSDVSIYMLTVVKTLMHIRKIDGLPVAMPSNGPSAKALTARFTDAGMDLLINAYLEHFQVAVNGVNPAVQMAVAEAVKNGIITAEQGQAITGVGEPVSPLSAGQ